MQAEKTLESELLEEMCDVLESRSGFYLMLAGLYFKPLAQEQIDRMAEEDYGRYAVGETLLDEGFDDIRRVLRKRHTGTRRILATEWTSTFGGTEAYKGCYCVPNASVFLDDAGLTYGGPRNEVSRVYGEQCLRLADNSGMPESHLSFELEFLAVLSEEAARHLRAGEPDEALRKLDCSRRFVEEHILTWFPQFMELALAMLQTRFYRGVLKITQGYLELDLRTLQDLEAEVR